MEEKNLNFKVYETLDSTNCEAKRLAMADHPAICVLALKQTNGRGRSGKIWHSFSDNFTASFLLYPNIMESKLPIYSYVAGLALYDAVTSLGIKPNQVSLKWPNDLLLNNKKIGGILLESLSGSRNKKVALVIGFGLNLKSSPSLNILDDEALPADSLKNSLLMVPESIEFLKLLIPVFEEWNKIFVEEGFNKIREGFLKRTIPVGTKIRVKTADKITIGNFFGISDEGSLILDCPTGQIFVASGDVFLMGK